MVYKWGVRGNKSNGHVILMSQIDAKLTTVETHVVDFLVFFDVIIYDIYSPKVLVIPRNRWLRLNMTEKLFTWTLNKNRNKNKTKLSSISKE